jgi:hypothetical protein
MRPHHLRSNTPTHLGNQFEAPEEEKKRQEYKNFTRIVYHSTWWEILKSLDTPEHYGAALKCGDNAVRVFFPAVYILSMDFEEQ